MQHLERHDLTRVCFPVRLLIVLWAVFELLIAKAFSLLIFFGLHLDLLIVLGLISIHEDLVQLLSNLRLILQPVQPVCQVGQVVLP